MSDERLRVTRYDVYDDHGRYGEPIEELDGQWVKYDAYRALQARVEEKEKQAQGYYNEAHDGWMKFREAERTIANLQATLEELQGALEKVIEADYKRDDVAMRQAIEQAQQALRGEE